MPHHAWSRVATDQVTLDELEVLLIVDYSSAWLEMEHLKDTRSETVIIKCKVIFAWFGSPQVLATGNGLQLALGAFQKFTAIWNIKHAASSPYHPRS